MIEAVSEHNLQEVLPLIRDYQAFYKVAQMSDAKNTAFFSQFGEASPAGCQFIYRKSSKVIGFATVYFTYASTIIAKVGTLNDLFTLPDYRGQGVGRTLIEHCQKYAAKHGATRLQWVTALDNEKAQKLYDSMETRKSTWHFYVCNTS